MVALVPPGARADDDPLRQRMPLEGELLEDRLGDVVVAPPVGGPLGEGELVQVVPAALGGQPAGLRRTCPAACSTKWQRPPWNSISAIFSGLVVAGMTATNGSPSMRAK